jgi:hypothetical protein
MLFVVCQPAWITVVKAEIVQSIGGSPWITILQRRRRVTVSKMLERWAFLCVRGGVAVVVSPTKAMSALNVPSKSIDSNSSQYCAKAKSVSKKTTSSNSDSVQRSAIPTATKQKRTLSRANSALSPAKKQKCTTSGSNTTLPPPKKQKCTMSQANNSKPKLVCKRNTDSNSSEGKQRSKKSSERNTKPKATWETVTNCNDGCKKVMKPKAIGSVSCAQSGNTDIGDISPPATMEGNSGKQHKESTFIFVQCSGASMLCTGDVMESNNMSTHVAVSVLQCDTTSCSDNVSAAFCDEFLVTKATQILPYKTDIEEDISVVGNNAFSPL